MTEIGGRKFHNRTELEQMRHDAELRMQVLETALRQIAEQPSDDPAALKQIAATALDKAGEVRSAA